MIHVQSFAPKKSSHVTTISVYSSALAYGYNRTSLIGHTHIPHTHTHTSRARLPHGWRRTPSTWRSLSSHRSASFVGCIATCAMHGRSTSARWKQRALIRKMLIASIQAYRGWPKDCSTSLVKATMKIRPPFALGGAIAAPKEPAGASEQNARFRISGKGPKTQTDLNFQNKLTETEWVVARSAKTPDAVLGIISLRELVAGAVQSIGADPEPHDLYRSAPLVRPRCQPGQDPEHHGYAQGHNRNTWSTRWCPIGATLWKERP